jgi:hypothetical protein
MLRVTAKAVHRLAVAPTILEPHKRPATLAGPSARLPTPGAMLGRPKSRPVAAGALLALVPEALNQLLLRGLFIRRTRYT